MAKYRRQRPLGPKVGLLDRRPFAEIRAEDYSALYDIVRDPGTLPGSYDHWRERSEHQKRDWKRRGKLAVSVPIDAEKLLAWCARNGVQANVDAFHMFLEERVRRKG